MNKLSKTELREIRVERRMKYEQRVGGFTARIRKLLNESRDDQN